jgi:hypothetical protein
MHIKDGRKEYTMEKQTYPRLPKSNWWTLRSQFKKTIPSIVTISYLKSLLDLDSEKSAKNLLGPLKQLGLIDGENKPTQRANDWRDDKKYTEVCNSMIKDIFPSELIDLFPDSEVDFNAVKNWFMHSGQLGEVAAGQNAQMFVLLKSGFSDQGLTGPTIAKQASLKKNNARKENIKKNFSNSTNDETVIKPNVGTSNHKAGLPSVHIDLQIHISPDASSEQIDKVFESIARHLYGNN